MIYGAFVGSSNHWGNAPGGQSWNGVSPAIYTWNNANGELTGSLGGKWIIAARNRGDRPFKDPPDRHQCPGVWMMDAISKHYRVSSKMLLVIDSATYSELWAGYGATMFNRYKSIFEASQMRPASFLSISMAGSHTELDHPFVFAENIAALVSGAKQYGMIRSDALVILETVPVPSGFPDIAARLDFNATELPRTSAMIENSVIMDLTDLQTQDGGANIHYTADSSRTKGRRLFNIYRNWKG